MQDALHYAIEASQLPIHLFYSTRHAPTRLGMLCACQLLGGITFKLAYNQIPWELFKYFYMGRSGMEFCIGMTSTVFAQTQGLGVKNWDLCSKRGGFAPFKRRPKIDEKHSVAKTQRWISFKPGFGGYL